jgi:hypothetical protein
VSGRAALAAALVFSTTAFVAALVVRPHDQAPALDAFVLFLGFLGLVVATRMTSQAFPESVGQFEDALRPRDQPPPRLADLERLERTVEMATQSAFDVYYRLRPPLREIVLARLLPRGLDLEDERAHELLGDEVWAIVGPEATRPKDHFAPGAKLATIQAAVTRLEEL